MHEQRQGRKIYPRDVVFGTLGIILGAPYWLTLIAITLLATFGMLYGAFILASYIVDETLGGVA